jgi:transglutaminase-like putative cysteine protease
VILEVQHETRLSYSEPATEAIAEVRMEPISDATQSCRSFALDVSPSTGVFRYQDGFGNRVHHFNVLVPHVELTMRAASIVETYPPMRSLEESEARWPVSLERGGLDLYDFLHLRGPVTPTAKLQPLVESLGPSDAEPLPAIVHRVCTYIHTHFVYDSKATLASSPIDDVLTYGRGVCQDFTHLMIAILRSYGVPARYVSGYIHRPGKPSESHAWCEVWLPDVGWMGLDPTNDTAAGETFVKVAIGRDFTDVPPNKGIYRGRASESISVRVETRERKELPSLSWQEQLPPLETPLTTIVSGRQALDLSTEDDANEQRQQQQQ